MRRITSIAMLLPAVLLLASGCATRNWVREMFQKKEVEIDQRFVSVEGRVTQEAQRVEGIGSRVQTVEGSVGRLDTSVGQLDSSVARLDTAVGETAGLARAARGRADEAWSRAESVDGRLTRLWASRHQLRPADSVEVYFGFGQADLSDGAQTALRGIVRELKESAGAVVALEGYTDPRGALEYNYLLSQRRVEAVRRFLAGQGIALNRIHAIGLGPIADRGLPDPKKRRVTVTVMVDAD